MIIKEIFELKNEQFDEMALNIFRLQSQNNPIYQKFLEILRIIPLDIQNVSEIPFLPIEFFKTQCIKTGEWQEQKYFLSSGTSNQARAKHFIKDIIWYDEVTWKIIDDLMLKAEYLKSTNVQMIALLPSPSENPYSSLTHMVNSIARRLNKTNTKTIFYNDFKALHKQILCNNNKQIRTILFGVSFALVDFANLFPISSEFLTLIETGGMKSDRRQMVKSEILQILHTCFPQSKVMSEYGMTELLSQAYALDGFNFTLPDTMKIVISAIDDQSISEIIGKRGRINIIDLANVDTCSFIQTGDSGILNSDGTFQVLGRIQDEELRGCNLLYGL